MYMHEIDGIKLRVHKGMDHALDEFREKYTEELKKKGYGDRMIRSMFQWAKDRSESDIPGPVDEYPGLYRRHYMSYLEPTRAMSYLEGLWERFMNKPVPDSKLESNLKQLVRKYARKLDIELV